MPGHCVEGIGFEGCDVPAGLGGNGQYRSCESRPRGLNLTSVITQSRRDPYPHLIDGRRRAELVARTRSSELIHLNRTAEAGALSDSLAHELSQPTTS